MINRALRLTDDFYRFFESAVDDVFQAETEARWRLVETAWSLKLSENVVNVHFDEHYQALYTYFNQRGRVDITSVRSALNGYQKSRCFYCGAPISLISGSALQTDVDHFFPHILKTALPRLNVDGVWNLVLSCQKCNRGPAGKFALLPHHTLLSRLYARNEYLITSHHPLSETLQNQTGKSEKKRKSFLQDCYNEALPYLIHTWMPEDRGQIIL